MSIDAGGTFSPAQADAIRALVAAHSGRFVGALEITPTSGGQSNPTFFLEWDGGSAVLRKQPSGELAPSAHAIDREYRLLEALEASDVPVPRPILYHEGSDLLGTPFYIMERLRGRIFNEAALPGVPVGEKAAMYRAMARALARLHGFDWRAAGLADFGRPSEYYPRQFRRWKRFWSEHHHPGNPDLDFLLDWLEAQPFPDEDTVISHGDFRFANVMFSPDGPEVVGILDWELSTLGPSAADLAFSATCYHTRPDENGGLLGLDLAGLGIPPSADYAAAYFEAAGSDRQLSVFEQAFALFRAAAGSESIAARARAGQGVGADSAAFGQRMALAYARGARRLIEGRS